MSNRKQLYLSCVIVLAIGSIVPIANEGTQLALDVYQFHDWPLLLPLGIGDIVHDESRLISADFWHDRIQSVEHKSNNEWNLIGQDIETGQTRGKPIKIPMETFYSPVMAFGDRIWVIESRLTVYEKLNNLGYFGLRDRVGKLRGFEIIDGDLHPSDFIDPDFTAPPSDRFLLDNRPALVNAARGVFALEDGEWLPYQIMFPDPERSQLPGGPKIDFAAANRLRCINQGKLVHVFLEANGLILHREGLTLGECVFDVFVHGLGNSPRVDFQSKSVSALSRENANVGIEGWSIVTSLREVGFDSEVIELEGMLIGGQPAAFIIDNRRAETPTGYLHRFDGQNWQKFGSITFPLGARTFRAVCSQDQKKSWIIASSSLGAGSIYSADQSGVRLIRIDLSDVKERAWRYLFYLEPPAIALITAIVYGTCTWLCMWWLTKPQYESGNNSIKLASLGRRAAARLIDLAIVVLSTAGLGWFLTAGLDWLTFFEALNLRINHETIHLARRVALILLAYMIVTVIALLLVQGRSGLSPGKWICGLRTLRTTLRPCGFARSLTRELLMCVDCCNFLCWTPGILSIALTEYRQRIGDLVADTVVIDARSLSNRLPVEQSP